MSKVDQIVSTLDNDVKAAYNKVAALWSKAKQAWVLISSPQTRSVMLTLTADAVKLVRDTEAAAVANAAQPLAPPTLALDQAVYTDIKQLIADAKAGDGVILNDLKVLGVTL